MKTILAAFSTLVVVAAMSGLDFSIDPKSDPYLIKDYTIYSTKGSPVLIHCRTGSDKKLQIKIVSNPSFGTVRVVNNGSVHYEPNLQTSKDEDRFVIEMVSAQGKKTASIRISSVKKGPLVNYVWL